jgi:hypothetical protein
MKEDRMTNSPTRAERYIARLPAAQQEIAVALRELIRKAAPQLEETVKWGYPCFLGSEKVCSIMAFKDHVNLAFFRGAELADPHGLLEGTGKGMRHVKFRSVSDIRAKTLAALVKAAAQLEGS